MAIFLTKVKVGSNNVFELFFFLDLYKWLFKPQYRMTIVTSTYTTENFKLHELKEHLPFPKVYGLPISA